MALSPRDKTLLAATAALAIGVPISAAMVVRARTADLAAHLGDTGGVPVRIGAVDADLTGAVRLSDVAFGTLVEADAVEASVSLASILSGDLGADEIRVEGPRVAVSVDRDGDSNLARLARRFVRARSDAPRTGGRGRVRRVVVSEGSLTAHIAGLGEVSADGVELIPDDDGVRVVTGRVAVSGGTGPLGIEIAFARSAAELSLRDMRFRRVLAVGGEGTVDTGDRTLALRDVAAGRLSATGALELSASLDDGGVPRQIAAELTPTEVAVRGELVPLRAFAPLAPRGLIVDDARATGEVRVRTDERSTEVIARGSLSGARLDHRSLAATPIDVDATIDADVAVTPEAITVTRLGITTGAIDARLAGWLRRGEPLSGQLDVEIANARCNDLLASLPLALREPLDGMVLDGELGARARLAIDLAAPPGDGTTLTTELRGACRALAEPPAADVTTLAVAPVDPAWVPIDKLPSRVKGAFVSAEDGRFWTHGGFDLFQIARSLEINLRERRLARGGSTISQQLVKNALLTHRRSLDRKLQEAILTWRLEARLTKLQILERYLNIIELGPRVHGITAAAKHWFGVTPRELTTRQAAFLAALTSEPTSMARRVRRHGGLDPDSAERVATVLRAMKRDGVISTEDYDLARHAGMGFASTALRAD